MRQREHLQPDESICIICEGEKTEPYFFEELIAWMEREHIYRDYQYRIYPVPVKHADANCDNGGRKTKRRLLENVPDDSNEHVILRGPMPECWVDSGIAQLGNFTEVWVVFDKDEHPHHKEAFNKVRQIRRENGKLNLAFSSRCFETYLLQHFEYSVQSFQKSECNEKKSGNTRYFNCCTDNAVAGKACDGDRCINGYARRHGYWQNSKNGQAFSVIPNLWRGVLNSHRLKWYSLASTSPTTEVYERNPYLDTYRLTLRLLGLHSLEHGEFVSHKVGNGQSWNLQRKGNTLIFKNDSELTMSVPEKAISIMKVLPDGKPLIDVEWQINDYPEEIKVSAGEQFIMTIDDLLASDNQYLKIHWFGDIYFCAREDGINDDFDMTLFDLSTC
jgi:hypothetical protein